MAICSDGQGIKITGDLESVDEDGYMVLRLGSSIVTFMTQGMPAKIGSRVQVRVESVEVYPVEY